MGGLTLACAALFVPLGSAMASPAPGVRLQGPGSLAGTWLSAAAPRSGPLRTADGQRPPLQPWAAKLLDERMRQAAAGKPVVSSVEKCLPGGTPRSMLDPGTLIEIVETPGQVTILLQQLVNFRVVLLDARHVDDPDPGYLGDSIGHWDGNTLVIDTIGLNDVTNLDAAGTPHSESLHVVERLRRIDADTLELTVRLDDPKAFTRPWTARTLFKAARDRRLGQAFCAANMTRAHVESRHDRP